jgi:hypothetical protein
MKTNDLSKVMYILNNKIYNNQFILKSELKYISDDKIRRGLVAELYLREYDDLNIDKLFDDFQDYANHDLLDCHNYYITKLIEDPYIKLMDYFNPDREELVEDEFIDWVKSLSNNDIKHIELMCLEKEEYEYIGLVLNILQNN